MKEKEFETKSKTPPPNEKQVEELLELIKAGEAKISEQSDNITLVIGNSRVGKSTLVNYLTGVPLKARMTEEKEMVIEIDQKSPEKIIQESAVIGHEASTTTVPKALIGTGVKYWDCPGFDDTKGTTQDIANAFYIKKLFGTSKSFKFVIVTSFSSIRVKGGDSVKNFTSLIKSIGKLFTSVEDLEGSACLVITKIGKKFDISDVRKNLEKIINNEHFKLNSHEKSILKLFADEGNEKIALFRKPKKEKVIDDEDKEAILSMIEASDFVTNPKTNIAVAPTSINSVRDLADHVSGKMSEEVSQIISEFEKQENCDNPEELFRNNFDVRSQKDKLQQLVEGLKHAESFIGKIYNDLQAIEKSEDTALSKIKSIHDKMLEQFVKEKGLALHDHQERFKKYIDWFEFFINVNPNAQNSLSIGEIIKQFIDCKEKVINALDYVEGILSVVIADEVERKLQKFVSQVHKKIELELNSAIENGDKIEQESLEGYINQLVKLANPLTKSEDIECVHLLKQLEDYSTSKCISLNLVKDYKELLRLAKGDEDRKNSAKILKEGVQSITQLKSKLESQKIELAKSLYNKFEQSVYNYIDTLMASNKDKTFYELQEIINKLTKTTTFESQSSRSIINMLIELFPINNSLSTASSLLDKLSLLGKEQELAKSNSTFNILEHLRVTRDKLNIDLYRQAEEAVSSALQAIIDNISLSFENINITSQQTLLNSLEELSEELKSYKNSSDCLKSLRHFGQVMGQKIGKELTVNKVLEELIKLNLNIKYKNFSDIVDRGIEDLKQTTNNKVIQAFANEIGKYEEVIENKIDNFDGIKSLLYNLKKWFSTSILELKGISNSEFYEKLSATICKDKEISSLQSNALEKLNILKTVEGKITSENMEPLYRIYINIERQLEWYEKLEKLNDNITQNCENIINKSPAIGNKNFDSFVKELLNSDGLSEDYQAYKASQVNSILKHVALHPQIQNSSGNLSVISGYVKISQVQKYISAGANSVTIKCLNSIIFDSDLKAAGVNFLVVTPFWCVTNQITIDLSGTDAPSNLRKAKNGIGYKFNRMGSDGTDGLDGRDGGNAGSFYGVGCEFKNLHKLKFKLEGGNGSNGQHGGNGAKGHYGLNASRQDFWDNKGTIIPNKADRCTKYEKSYNRIELVKGQSGGSGGNGGRPGMGGKGGHSGKFKLKGTDEKLTVICKSGVDGRDGKEGRPGMGGKNGNDLEVYYFQNQYTTVRGTETIVINSRASAGKKTPIKKAKKFHFKKDWFKIAEEKLGDEIQTLIKSIDKKEFYYKIQMPKLKNLLELSGQGILDNLKEVEQGIFGYVNELNKYYAKGMDHILNLRIEDSLCMSNLKALSAKYLFTGSETAAGQLCVDVDLALQNSTEKLLVPINLYNKHWVGLVFEQQEDDKIVIKYMDPENNPVPEALEKALIAELSTKGYEISFEQIEVEHQLANNCGPEVIENFVWYLTGERMSQEDAVKYHSRLVEKALLSTTECEDEEDILGISAKSKTADIVDISEFATAAVGDAVDIPVDMQLAC